MVHESAKDGLNGCGVGHTPPRGLGHAPHTPQPPTPHQKTTSKLNKALLWVQHVKSQTASYPPDAINQTQKEWEDTAKTAEDRLLSFQRASRRKRTTVGIAKAGHPSSKSRRSTHSRQARMRGNQQCSGLHDGRHLRLQHTIQPHRRLLVCAWQARQLSRGLTA